MKKSWLLAFSLCFVLIASFATPVFAKAEVQHGVYHDVDSETEWWESPLPEECFPYTVWKVHTRRSWADHVVYHNVSDGRGGYRVKMQFSHSLNTESQVWFYDSVDEKWVDGGCSSWSIASRSGTKLYVTEAELKQGMTYSVVRKTVKQEFLNITWPEGWLRFQNMERTFEFHYMIKILNGELRFLKVLKSPVRLTGVIYDRGVDTDGDGTYNYLEIGVKFRVDNPGYCTIGISDLRDKDYNYIRTTASAWDYLEAGTHIVNLRFSGVDIYRSSINPSYIGWIQISYYDYFWGESAADTLRDVRLSRTYFHNEFDAPGAYLTGIITDQGVDTDYPPDGKFDYLEIGVEVEVLEDGYYAVDTKGLLDEWGNFIWAWSSNSTYLETGTQNIYLRLDGPTIYASGLNPSNVSLIRLYDGDYCYIGDISNIALSRTYSYDDFNAPPPPPPLSATLTGFVTDEGVDTDGNGLFNYLEIGVEVQVYEAGYYDVCLNYLLDEAGNWIWVWDSKYTYLDVGTQFVYLQLDGPTIYAQGLNPRSILWINLWDEYWNYLGSVEYVPLSTEYSYDDFDAPVLFYVVFGNITDQGVDTDYPPDGKFDYLEIGIQIEVSEAGTYIVEVDGLVDEEGNLISAWGSSTAYLSTETQFVYVQVDARSIYMQGLNPSRILSLSLYDKNYNLIGSIGNIPLSRTYSYTEFDAQPPPPPKP